MAKISKLSQCQEKPLESFQKKSDIRKNNEDKQQTLSK